MDRARKAEPFGNAATYSREKSRQLVNHFNRISHVQARVDSSAPKQRMVGFTTNSVEQKILRLQEIEAENRRLLHKISSIATAEKESGTREFRWNKLRGQKKRLNEGVRRREHERIWKENQLILKRLKGSKPTLSKGDWKKSEKWNKNFLAGADRRRAMLRLDNVKIPVSPKKSSKLKRTKTGSKTGKCPAEGQQHILRPMTQSSQRAKISAGIRPTTSVGNPRGSSRGVSRGDSRSKKPKKLSPVLKHRSPTLGEPSPEDLVINTTPGPEHVQLKIQTTDCVDEKYEEEFDAESPVLKHISNVDDPEYGEDEFEAESPVKYEEDANNLTHAFAAECIIEKNKTSSDEFPPEDNEQAVPDAFVVKDFNGEDMS